MAGQPTHPSKIKAWTLPAWLRETTPLGLYFSGRGTLGRVAWSAIKWSGCFVGGAELLGVGVPVGWGKVHALHTINVHVKSIHLHFLGCKSLSFTRSLLVFVALGYFEGPFACCFPEEFMNVYVYIYTHSFSNLKFLRNKSLLARRTIVSIMKNFSTEDSTRKKLWCWHCCSLESWIYHGWYCWHLVKGGFW